MSVSKLGSLHLTGHTGPKHTATVIFFHGSGSCGKDIKEWVRLMVKSFSFPHIKVLYPTAPLQPYTPAGGMPTNVWFDRDAVSPLVKENLASIGEIENEVRRLIKNEHLAGIPSNRIIVGGFSMGGALSLHTAYRWDRNLAGTFAFSSFLNQNSVVYQELKKANAGTKLPPLLQLHGDSDDLVDANWALDTYNELENLGVHVEFHMMEKLGHSLNRGGMKMIMDFIVEHLPEQQQQ